MNDNIESLLSIQAATQSIGLLGRTVEVATDTESVVGEVTSLRFANGQPLASVRTAQGQVLNDLTLSRIVVVR
jgi:flagellar basal-body rod modification protein FlgD